MKKNIAFFCFIFFINIHVFSQEFSSNVQIQAGKLNSSVDKNVFVELQKKIEEFINNKKWTNEEFLPHEKINASFFLNIESIIGTDIYQGNLNIQVSRPVFNSTYTSPLFNFKDENVVFKYALGQNILFNETNISGNNPHEANITAIFAYYSNIIVGLYLNSFSKNSGKSLFLKAQNIVNNAPYNKDIIGWRSNEDLRNRFWLVENLLNSRYAIFHQFLYEYFRTGLDNLYENADIAKTNIIKSFENLYILNAEYNGVIIVPVFMQGRTEEVIGIFKQANAQQKSRVLEMMDIIDLLNYDKYKAAF